jgi:hypothetical protein
MGYDVYITRAESPDESSQHPIPEAEWSALLQNDSSLVVSPTDYYERSTSDGQTERFQSVLWTAHPDRPPFMLIDGAVQIKSPDDATIQKMVEMAGRLSARVVGEEGEVYPLNADPGSRSIQPSRPAARSWPSWTPFLIAFLIGCLLLALKLLIFGL